MYDKQCRDLVGGGNDHIFFLRPNSTSSVEQKCRCNLLISEVLSSVYYC